MKTSNKTVVGIGLGAYLVAFGVLSGMVIERMCFDAKRAEVIGRYEQALHDWQMYRIALEKGAETPR